MAIRIERAERKAKPQMVPRPVQGETGLVQVDATWGTIQPMQATDSVRTVGELDVIEHLEQGGPVVDARTRDEFEQSTIPGARHIPHREIAARLDELDPERPTILFCNGPQCGQSPVAIRALLGAGYPAEGLLYYRGGLHDWLTLGLPVVQGESRRSSG